MVARVKTWTTNETLASSDLNAEFDNIVNAIGSSTADHIDLTDVYAWTGAHSWSAATTHTNTLTVGVDDTGHDVKFFGATSGQYMLWDESADELVLAGDSKLSFHDAAGGENIIATSNGHLEVNAGTTLDITAPTVDLNSSTKFNIDTAAYDLNASGAVTIDSAGVSIDSSAASNLTTSGGALTITSAAAATWSTAAGDLTLGSGAAINITPAAGSVILLDGTISVDAGVVTGATAITLSGELDAGSLDVSGNADIDGTLEADAYTVDGTALNEYIADTIGAMVTSNTETGITVAYQDADNTLDFTIGTLNQDTTGTAALATTVTITDNESTNETNAIIFTAGGDVDGGNLGLESDGNLTYNPSSGLLSSTTLTTTGVVTAGGVTLADSAPITMGTGSDATLQFNATNTVLATAGALILQTNGTTEAMRIAAGGDVGIGTASPSSILHAKIAARNTAYDASDWKTWSDIHVVNPQNTSGGVFPATGISFTVDANDYDNGSAGIAAVAGDADSEHALAFVIRPNGAVSKEAMRIDSSGNVFIGDTANANMTVGLTINMGANDDEILALKSSDVAHAITGVSEADSWFYVKKLQATSGGANLVGLKDADGAAGLAIQLSGYLGEAVDTTKSTGAQACVTLEGAVTDGGTSIAACATNGNVVTIKNSGTARFIFDAEGDSHQDVGTAWTNFDDEDDAMICRSVGIVMDQGSIVRSQFDDWGRDHKADLIRTGLIPKLSPEEEANGDRPLMNTTQLARLHNGAIWQLHEQMETMKLQLEEANAKLALLEMN